jgi:16S rRNA processing protein RimM
MEKSNCVSIGRIHKTFGYKGSCVVQIGDHFLETVLNEGSVFIENDEELVPYFIETFEEGEEGLHSIKFEDIDDVDRAKELNGSLVWFPLSSLPEALQEADMLFEIRGYQVIDQKFGEIGIAEDVMDMPQQSLLRFFKGKKEILLPMNETFIHKIDRRKKQIFINAPDGLIDSYLA